MPYRMTKVRSVAAVGDAAVGAVSSSLMSISTKLLIDSDLFLLEIMSINGRMMHHDQF